MVVGGVHVSGDFPVEVTWVTPQLAMGTMIGTNVNMQHLASEGITHVLNLQCNFNDSKIVGDTGISVFWLPLDDNVAEAPLEGAVKFAAEALQYSQNTLFIHCVAGLNRSPKLAYAVLRFLGNSHQYARDQILKVEPDVVLEEHTLQILSSRIESFQKNDRLEIKKKPQ